MDFVSVPDLAREPLVKRAAIAGSVHLLATLARGEYALAAVDLAALAFAMGFACLALRGWRTQAAMQPQLQEG